MQQLRHHASLMAKAAVGCYEESWQKEQQKYNQQQQRWQQPFVPESLSDQPGALGSLGSGIPLRRSRCRR